MRARLTVEAGAAEPHVFDLNPDMKVSLGRNRTNSVVLQDQHASRFHAEVYFADGAWQVRDCGTTNGTKLDGVRIQRPVRLRSEQVIGVGEARVRFSLDPSKERTAESIALTPDDEAALSSKPTGDLSPTLLQPDELTSLFQFMNASLTETNPRGLVRLALRCIQVQTRATVCGYLGFEDDDPHMKVVLPEGAEVDVHLSRQLTQRARRASRAVWLDGPVAANNALESESLVAYRDAICVPLRRTPPASAGAEEEEPLGALHVYKSSRGFSEREVRFCEVLAGCLASALHVLRARRALEADNSRLRIHAAGEGSELLGDSPALHKLRNELACLARSACTVLIEGESGVGKELAALALHRLSPRHQGPLVSFNCAALTAGLPEAELFGHEKGTFTGADRERQGLFQQADEGTLFLDEIGELSQETQARLLRVLETKSVRPLLAEAEIKLDVRIVAATNRDLEREVKAGRFRRDLFFRLGTRIRIPPLRDHLEDVPALAAHFLEKLSIEYRRRVTLSPEALRRLQTYPWPGNVRQLRMVLETAVAMAPANVLRPADLRLESEQANDASGPPSLQLDEIEAWAIREALGRTGGVQVQAAKLLGIHRDTLINKMKRYGIEKG